MSNIADFKIRLLKEKTDVMMDLSRLKQKILNDITYLDKSKIIMYCEQIDILIASINDDYTALEDRHK